MNLQGGLLKGTLSILLFVATAYSEKITLDVHSTLSKEWFEVTCIYNDDTADFWVFGCPVNLPEDHDEYPQRKGFWTPCGAKCEIHYFGGPAQAKSITLNMYVKGSPDIKVTSKYSPLDPEFDKEVDQISYEKESGGWKEYTIDTNKISSRALVLNFSMATGAEDMLLLDSITVDIGDEFTFPTEPPPTTTPLPIDGDTIFLDKDYHYSFFWGQDCSYSEETHYMWAYGCPDSPQAHDTVATNSTGFWGTCEKTKCRLQYIPLALIPHPSPETVTIDAYMEGAATIDLMVQWLPLDVNCNFCVPVGQITAPEGGGWISKTIAPEIRSKDARLNIYMNREKGGSVMIDKVAVKLFSQLPPDGESGGGSPPGGGGDSDGNGRAGKLGWADNFPLMLIMSLITLVCARYF